MKKKLLLSAVLLAVAAALHGLRPDPEVGRESQQTPTAGIQATARPGAPVAGERPGWLERLSGEVAAFRRWAQYYNTANAAERTGMVDEGKTLARAHRERMRQLITTDPRRALEEAVPVGVRQKLPPDVAELLEERVNARGNYAVLGRAAGEGQGIARRFTDSSGNRYEAMVYGRRVRQPSMENAALHGVAVDGLLAVHEDPLRAMETGERILPGQPVFSTCPVSGQSTPSAVEEITEEIPAVETGGEVHILCSGGHIHVLNDQLKAAEGATGGPSKPTGSVPSSWTTGVKSVLYIRVTFPEQNTDPQGEKDAYDMMKLVNDFFVENSHGQLHLMTTVTPLLLMPKAESWYKANDSADADAVLADARAAARAAGFDYAAYDLEAVRYNGASGSFGGQAYVGGRGCWLKSSGAGVACHEFGHNLGLWHANYWSTGGETVTGSGTNSEYGNSFDTMGAANAGNYFFNAGHQNDIRWLPDENVTRISRSGMYRIYQQDQGRIDPANRYLLAIKKDQQRDYWCEFRQRFTANRWLSSGVSLQWSPWGDGSTAGTAYGSNGGGQLLDSTPGSPDGKDDSAVVIGRTFSDPGAQVHITPVAKGGTVPESIDVVVNTGAFPGNQPPSLELQASVISAALNEPVTFTATAVDPEGDPLAYAWDWGDRTFGPNTAVAVKSWAAAGIYPVRCEASDMRGGTRSVIQVVTVGNPSAFSVSGRVLTSEGQPLAGARVYFVPAGSSGATPKVCLSDSAGNYTVGNLAAGDYTAAAASPAYTLTPVLPNPLNVSAPVAGADFTAAAKPTVTMSLDDASCTEGGDGAVLRFTRTAAVNTSAIDVRVFAGGSAGMGDVDFTPAEIYDLTTYKFTIPANQNVLDVAVSAFNDSSAEGPETMTFFLIDGSGYIPSGVESVTLAVEDNDNSLPVVSVEALADSLTEGGDNAVIRLSRTGPVGNALAVSLVRAGTAAAATDYSGVGTLATIPAGAAFVDLTLAALQDSDAEGSETVSLSIGTSALWIRSPLRNAVSLTLLDDDIPTVSIIAADNAASEAGSDPAVFVITRSGALSTPLTVDYAMGGTAQHGTDYQPMAGTVTIPAGLAHAALTVTPVDDAIGELSQTVTVNLRSAARYTLGPAFSASASLADNDLPHVAVTVSDGACDEGGGTGKFRIQSSATGTGNVTVFYTLSGTAESGADFTPVTGSIAVPRSGYAEVVITPVQDTDPEDAESVILTLLPDAAYTLAPGTPASLLILDDEQPAVSVSTAAKSYGESSGPAKFYFARSGATTAALTVSYGLSGTAAAGADFTAPTGTVTIPAGSVGLVLNVDLLDDSLSEGAETLICTVTPAPGSYGTRESAAMVFLTDNETAGLPVVNFASASSTAAESAGAIAIPVTLDAPAAGEVRVDYALESGLAFNGVDYTAAGGTVVFAAGQTAASIPLFLLDDIFREPQESLGIRLVRAYGARTGSTAMHALTIADNDTAPPPVIGFTSAASSAGEAAGQPGMALVFLSSPQASAVSVDWSVSGGTAGASDIGTASGSLTFQPGETVRSVPLALVDDVEIEAAETIVLTLSTPQSPAVLGTATTHTVTLTDNDDTTISLAVSGTLSEAGPSAAVVTVSRVTTNPGQPVTVALAFGGSAGADTDYLTPPASVVIPAGENSVSFALTPVDDADLDPAETVSVSVAASTFYSLGNPVSASLTIEDNETGIAIAAGDAVASEPSEPAEFTLTRSGPAGGELVVGLSAGGSAEATGDFVPLPASVVFGDGQTELKVTVVPVDDYAVEPDETLTLSVLPGPGYVAGQGSATVTIRDDDTNTAPVITLNSPVSGTAFIPEGPGLMVEAAVSDDGLPRPTVPITVEWSKLSGPGTVEFADSAAAATSVRFGAPGAYVLQLRAADAELSTAVSVNVFVLSNTLTGVNVGTTSALTSLSGSGKTWTLNGAGAGVSTGTTDGCFFGHRQMSGDFTVVTRVDSLTGTAGTSSRCGVMVRSALGSGARQASMSVTSNRSSFVWRANDSAAGAASNTNQTAASPRFVRLRRVGLVFTAAHSIDGVSWTNQGSAQTISMPDPVYVGLFGTNASTTGAAAVVAAFSEFAITRTGNTGPYVSAGTPVPSGLDALLSGTVTDDTGTPLVSWLHLSGPGTATLPASAAGMAHFTAAGSHTLRLVADDGLVRTFADTTVTATSPFSDWQMANFPGATEDASVAGPQADPDHDGLANAVEYALLSNPNDPASAKIPDSSRAGDLISITWRESTAASDSVVQPLWSGDLVEWQSEGFAIEVTGSAAGWVEKRATFDASSHRRVCLQLRVSLP